MHGYTLYAIHEHSKWSVTSMPFPRHCHVLYKHKMRTKAIPVTKLYGRKETKREGRAGGEGGTKVFTDHVIRHDAECFNYIV